MPRLGRLAKLNTDQLDPETHLHLSFFVPCKTILKKSYSIPSLPTYINSHDLNCLMNLNSFVYCPLRCWAIIKVVVVVNMRPALEDVPV